MGVRVRSEDFSPGHLARLPLVTRVRRNAEFRTTVGARAFLEGDLLRCNVAKPKVPIISTDARDQALNFDSAKWRQIENACGVSVPPNVRADIDRATQAFLFFESFEHAPEPLAKVKVILQAHDKAATRFFNELFASPFAGSDTGVYAHHLCSLRPRRQRTE